MQKIIKNFPFTGLIIVLLITISVSYFGLRTLRARDNADDITTHTNEVLIKLDEVLLGLVNMQTGLRGYMITGDTQFLDHYRNGLSQYDTAMQALKSLTVEDASLEQRWRNVEKLEQQWKTEWGEKGIQIRQDFDAGKVSNNALSSHMVAESDETVMDLIRAELDSSKQEATFLLVQQIRSGQEADYRAYLVMVAGVAVSVVLGLLSGLWLNQANNAKAKQIELQHLLIEEREKERLQLARELHDGPVQELIAVTFTAQQFLSEDMPADVSDGLKAMRTSLQGVISELRSSAMELRSPVLSKFGLQKAIQLDLEAFQQKYPDVMVHYESDALPIPLPENRQATLFRIYQEAMRNIVRHAQASEVTVKCCVTEKLLTLIIQDNGKGFSLPDDWLNLALQGHFGLVGIRERTEALGGTVDLHSSPKNGTRIAITLPLSGIKSFEGQGA